MRTSAVNTVFMNENNENTYPVFRIIASMNNKTDETVVLVHNDASNEKDRLDAGKLFAPENKNFGVYTLIDNDAMSINSLRNLDTETIIPVGFVADAEGTVNFNFQNTDALNGAELYFEDLATNTSLNLKSAKTYSTSVKEGNVGNRFVIKAKKEVSSVEASDLNVYQSMRKLTLEGKNVANIKAVEVIANNAALVAAENNAGNTSVMQLNLPTLSEGIYLVKVVYNNNQTETKKVFLKN
jgi:hypothetical protein